MAIFENSTLNDVVVHIAKSRLAMASQAASQQFADQECTWHKEQAYFKPAGGAHQVKTQAQTI